MSRPGIKAFLSIENGLADKLKAAWHKSAFEVFYQVQHALDRRDYHGAVQIARSISLEQIVKDNRATGRARRSAVRSNPHHAEREEDGDHAAQRSLPCCGG
jgi:hypothetical protein